MSGKSIIFLSLFFFLQAQVHALSFMSYNVENLFDGEDDPGKSDEAYLPLKHQSKKLCKKVTNKYYRAQCEKTDWTQDKINQKIINIRDVVHSYSKNLDFLSVIEVENDSILKDLGKELGFKSFISTHSPDERGIDVALFYKASKDLVYTKTEEFNVSKDTDKPTRNILIGHFKYKKKELIILVNHWPSQGAPTPVRVAVAKKLREKLLSLKKEHPKASFIVTGDFNTLDREYPQPFDELKREELLVGTRKFLEKGAPPGSYFYNRDMSWNLLDRFFVSPDLTKKKVEFKIWNPSFITGVFEYTYKDSALFGSRVVGIPKRFDHKKKNLKKLGYSDHFPIILEIKD